MIDFLLGVALIALLLRGWMRGFVREVIGLAVIVIGIFLAFRLSASAGVMVSAMAGTSADASRFIGGIAVFLLVAAGGAVVSYIANKGIRFLPGLPAMNRIAGAGFAGIAGIFLATISLSVLALMPLGKSWDDRLYDSSIATFLTEPYGLPQTVLGIVGGDSVVATVLGLENIVGDRHLVGTLSRISFPSADHDELKYAKNVSAKLYDLINETRIDAGRDPLNRAGVLDELAKGMAFGLYTSGRFQLAPDIEDRIESAGFPVVTASEVIGMGVSAASIHEGFIGETASAEILEGDAFRRVGVAAVRGPLGLVVVVLLVG